jgi:hypothetical protein
MVVDLAVRAGGAGGGKAGGGGGWHAICSAAQQAPAEPPDARPSLSPQVALQYYMLAAAGGGGGIELKGRLFRELLVESKDYGGGRVGGGGEVAVEAGSEWSVCRAVIPRALACCREGRLNGVGWQ